jgi:PIN domain nuclease of toxin-antitoxin system
VSEAGIDSSALLALLNGESGAEQVRHALDAGASISTVNLCEVVSKLGEWGRSEEDIRAEINALGLEIVAFDEAQAFRAGILRTPTRSAGLSLGDRACLALAEHLGVPVLTADRIWQTMNVGVEIRLIR